jgi:uncharacterized membrane protein YecN with MAPEG domain
MVSADYGSCKEVSYPSHPAYPFFNRVRAHGNTAEYVPMMAVLILLTGSRNPSMWVLWTMGLAVASRYAIVAGILLSPTLDRPQPLRFVGALGTYITGLALSVAALLSI